MFSFEPASKLDISYYYNSLSFMSAFNIRFLSSYWIILLSNFWKNALKVN